MCTSTVLLNLEVHFQEKKVSFKAGMYIDINILSAAVLLTKIRYSSLDIIINVKYRYSTNELDNISSNIKLKSDIKLHINVMNKTNMLVS